VQEPDFCRNAAIHFTEPCRSFPGGTENAVATHAFPKNCPIGSACAVPLPPNCPDTSPVNCTGPDAGATLHVTGQLASSVVLPSGGFHCDCVCDDEFPTWLGSVSVLLRAVDTTPNYQQLEPQCGRLELKEQEKVFVGACDSSVRPNVVVC
jgi:hypothetical protein